MDIDTVFDGHIFGVWNKDECKRILTIISQETKDDISEMVEEVKQKVNNNCGGVHKIHSGLNWMHKLLYGYCDNQKDEVIRDIAVVQLIEKNKCTFLLSILVGQLDINYDWQRGCDIKINIDIDKKEYIIEQLRAIIQSESYTEGKGMSGIALCVIEELKKQII
jgi:hypothetical protein